MRIAVLISTMVSFSYRAQLRGSGALVYYSRSAPARR